MACSGNCTIQEFQTRNVAINEVNLDGTNCEPLLMAVDVQFRMAVGRETQDIVCGCDKKCQCVRIAGQDPPWTDWATATLELTLTNDTCTLTAKGRYEYRTRQLQGLCGPTSGRASVALIPEEGYKLVGEKPVPPQKVGKIKEILGGHQC